MQKFSSFRALLLVIVVAGFFTAGAQGQVAAQIGAARLFRPGDQTGFPAIALNSSEQLQLVFDDFDPRFKNYYYTFQLCNADWSPTLLRSFEYIKGFQNVRITTYRNSSLATARYVHYQATVPDRNCAPSRSGNYLLRVFLDNDTSKTVFTKRMVVYGNTAVLAAQIQQPFNAQFFRSGQKLMMGVQIDSRVNVLSAADVRVAVLQNNSWETARMLTRPTLQRGNYFEYSDEGETVFAGLKEFRWLDLRSLRLLSDRVQKMETIRDTQHILVKPDVSRAGQPYIYYRDVNGAYTIESMDNTNPFWQGDYAQVHFTFVPPANEPFPGADLYLFGELTQYAKDTTARLQYNAEEGLYETSLYLKQGYYNYAYGLRPKGRVDAPLDFSQTEGDHWATENAYTVLVYYRPFGARADEVIGLATVNAAFQRTGIR